MNDQNNSVEIVQNIFCAERVATKVLRFYVKISLLLEPMLLVLASQASESFVTVNILTEAC